MTPSELRALASRVETEEPTDDLRALVLVAFGSEAEPGSASDPLRSVDDARVFMPSGWRIYMLYAGWQIHIQHKAVFSWYCAVEKRVGEGESDRRYCQGQAPTQPRARTAAALRALAWEKEHTA